MIIKDLFEKDIFRSINGVVKADQTDEASVWQELDEFVITQELDRHLRDFFGWYSSAWDKIKKPDPSSKMGIWISGFFGSGKSHLLKVLSYLLRNKSHSFEGENKKAVQFFESKIKDTMLFADIKRAVADETDVILFNIDAKADHRTGRDLILRVFLKVLNELQGFSGDHPHIAHMERHLAAKGKLDSFKDAYKKHTGLDWNKERDAYLFNRDEVVKAFMDALGQSQTAAEKWIDGAEDNFAISIENFCRWTKEYLDSKGPNRRLVFLVDEVGQFIGQESKLMLNLQSIIEDLGVSCASRAWVVVTSQEDMESILNEMNKTKKEDFSKIQGRFKPPLSLSSANVDEVIQSRLLSKVPEVVAELKNIYKAKGDILKNQLSFKDCKMTFKPYRDEEDFVKNYPFAPYQFQLVQKVFEAIRKAGATGLHLARGERSMLDAFQSAAKTASSKEVGILVPMYDFYPSIESFLDTAVKKTIDQARSVPTLKPFDIKLLQVLFLIRYVEEVKGNVDNLVTLCLDQIDCDRLTLRRQIEESLGRLENESLISRNGDLYTFLTNEERDINREIRQIDLSSGEDSRLLGDIIFREVFKDIKKHRYTLNKMDFEFNRRIDSFPHGQQKDGHLCLNILSPLGDEYPGMDRGRCILKSSDNGGEIWIRLGNDAALGNDIRAYLQTNRFVTRKNDGTLPNSTKRIIENIATDNQNRYERLILTVKDMIVGADYSVVGQALKIKSTDPQEALSESFDYLINNTFLKMGFLKRLLPDPLKELQSVLRTNDLGKETLLLQAGENNPEALEDLKMYLDLSSLKSNPVILNELLEKRSLRPYGWVEGETLLLIGRLLVLGEIQLLFESAPIALDKAHEALTNNSKRKKIILKKRVITNPKIIQDSRLLGKELFSDMGPDGEDAITQFLKSKLGEWQINLNTYKPLAETGNYPGKSEITDCLILIGNLLNNTDVDRFVDRFNSVKKELLDVRDQYKDLLDFYNIMRPTWEKLRQSFNTFKLNRSILEKDEGAAGALRRMQEILAAKAPYGMIKEIDGLITKAEAVNGKLLVAARNMALEQLKIKVTDLQKDLLKANAPADLTSKLTKPLIALQEQLPREDSLAHIAQMNSDSIRLHDEAIHKMEEWLSTIDDRIYDPKPDVTDPKPVPSIVVVKKQHVVTPSKIAKSTYLETQEEVDEFLGDLRKELEQAIKNNNRIQIR